MPDLLEVTGAWIQVIGTAIAASRETLLVLENDEEDFNGNCLVMIGNAIEAAGNSLQAECLPTFLIV
ncbi:DUF6944 family repetitive protein [Pseudalkalibacillus sp. R45]|uniref:DUF6944 family repetitive protein n=1 Tax=Pseudalkalibacillus sp. R45 TaxID=3457433 RepID=UPI003FCEB66D